MRGKIFVLETFKMFCWFYAAQAHISCGGTTALWMELVECFPNKLGKLLCANSCETNDKIICHTNQCTNSRSSMYTSRTIFWKIQCLLKNFSGSFCESVIITLCRLRAWYPEQFRNQRCATYSTVYLRLSMYTCYVAPATFDNNKSEDSDITRGARMQNRHIV